MNSRTKLICIVLLVLMLALSFTIFAACKGYVPERETITKPVTKQVSVAMTEVYNAITASNYSQGVEEYTLTFNGAFSGEKELTYDFAANFDIGATNIENDTESELSFIISEETGSVLELFYKNGNLYIDYPPIISKGKFSGLNLAPIVKNFYDSNKPNGKIHNLAALIPTIGNYIFSDCMFSREDNVYIYDFTLSFNSFFSSLATVLQLADVGIGQDELVASLGLSAADIYALQNGGTGSVKISTIVTGGVAVFDKAEFSSSYTVDEINERVGLTMEDFVLKNGTSLVAMPTNLDTAYGNYSFGNLNLEGSIVINTETSDMTTEFGVSELLQTIFSSNQYTYYYTLKSNITNAGEITLDMTISSTEEKSIMLYFAEDILYMDLTEVGFGKILTSADWIKDLFEGLDLLTDGVAITTNEKIALFAELLANSVNTDNLTSYSLGNDSISMLLDSIGYDSILTYDNISVSFNTTNNRLQSAALTIEALGARLTMSATTPVIGVAVTINEPAWITDCVDITTAEFFTPVLRGTISSNTLMEDDVTVIEEFVYSLTGETLDLDVTYRNDIKYLAQANIAHDGELLALKVDFLTSSDDYICSYYYTNQEEDNFYVILSEQDGINPIITYTIKNTERYSLFMQAINGNAVGGEYDDALLLLSNAGSNWSLSANRGAINNLLNIYKGYFSGSIIPSIPNDFAIYDITANFVDGIINTRVNFADNKYIDFTLEDFSLEYYDIGIAELGVENRSISIYSNNNMEDSTEVTFGDGTNAVFSLVSPSGDSIWNYSDIPQINSGTVNITASITLLGKTFNKNIEVNTAAYIEEDTGIVEAASPYYNSETRTFTFSRYNCNDNPIDIICAFQRAVISTPVAIISNKAVTWQNNGADIRTGGFNTLSSSSFNIIPVVESFFGTEIALYPSGTYTVDVEGAKAVDIVGSDDYLTITAYDGNNPYSESTYGEALVELEGGGTMTVNALSWDISSIHAGTISDISILTDALYTADGTYKINAVIADCMGKETICEVTINVVPRTIVKTVFETVSEGVTYEERETVGVDGIIGEFTFDSLVITSLSSTAVYANTAICNDGAFTLASLKWEIAPVASIDIFTGLNGEIGLVIGNEVGGYQTFRVLYSFPAVDVLEVGLADASGSLISHNEVEQKFEVTGSSINFSLLALDPYDYTYPDKVIFYYEGGQHEYNVDWAFNWDESKLWNRGETYKYTSVFDYTSLVVNLEMSFVSKIVKAYKFVENPTNNDQIFIRTVMVEETPQDIYIDYKLADGQKRLMFVSYGPFDFADETVLDYRNTQNYPSKVYVQFLGEGEEEWRQLDVTWDKSVYTTADEIMQYGYSGLIGADILYGQSIGDVYVSVAASMPDDTYVVYENEGATTDKKVRMSILYYDGELTITDPTDIANYPTELFLSYDDIASGWFTVAEWILVDDEGKNIVDEYIQSCLTAGTLLQNISNDSIIIAARFGDAEAGYIDIPIEVALSASTMSEQTLAGIPLVNTSTNEGGIIQNSMIYSMVEGVMKLSVDPYVANPCSALSYPTELRFKLNFTDTVIMDIKTWDLSSISCNNLHSGAECDITALIDVGMDYMIEIPVQLTIKERIIEKVWIDGSDAKTINIDPYSLQPFGENVEGNNAYKRVDVKFTGDDNTYLMVMKYDISEFTVSYTGGVAAIGVDVEVGNEAGGYQTLTGYNIYIKQSLVVNISTDAIPEGGVDPIGVLYLVTDVGGVFNEEFTALDSDELSALFDTPSLTINFGTPSDITTTREISEYDGVLEGLVYEWKRDAEGVLYLELWNNNPLYEGKLGENQIIVSGLTNYVEITHNLFNPTSILPAEGYEEEYSGITAGDFISANPLDSDVFTAEQMAVTMVRVSDDYVMQNDDVLDAGTYNYIISVTGHRKYGGNLIIPISITPIEVLLSNFVIIYDGLPLSLTETLLVGVAPNIIYYDGNEVILSLEVDELPVGILSIVYDGFEGNPTNAGTYNFDIASSSVNYSSDFSGSLTITEAPINEFNSVISVSDGTTTEPPVISISIDGTVLTIAEYSVYYGDSALPAEITISDYDTFIEGYVFENPETDTVYVKIVINYANYEITTIVEEYDLSKAQIQF